MKIRNGFVSNSSSSSFLIYGTTGNVGIEDLVKFQKAFPDRFQKAVDRFKNSKCESQKEKAVILEKLNDEYFFMDIKKRGCEHEIATNVKFCPECGEPAWITLENPNKKELAKLDDAEFCASIMGLESHSGEEDSYIGRSWDTIGDNETGAEFKKSIDDILMLIKGKKGSTCKEAWYNG